MTRVNCARDIAAGRYFCFDRNWYEALDVSKSGSLVQIKARVTACFKESARTFHFPPEYELETHEHIPF